MNRFRLHIASLFLAGFLFPQVANAVHYLVQPHSYTPKGIGSYDFSVPPYDYHVCDYQFHSLKVYSLPDNGFHPCIDTTRKGEEKYFYSVEFVRELAFHYSLRGPPHPDLQTDLKPIL